MRIIALVPGGIGEQLLFFPTLDTLKATYPEAQIDVLVRPTAVGAYRISGVVSEVIPFEVQARNSLADWGNLLGVIRDREYEIALAVRPTWTLSFLLWLSGIPVRVGFADSPGVTFLNRRITAKSGPYLAHRYHDLLQGLGIYQPCPELRGSVPSSDLEWADAERQRLGMALGGYVVIYGADGGYPTNNWDIVVEDFQKKQPDLPLLLVGDANNRELAATLCEHQPALKLSRPENLGQTAALLAAASLCLCTDSDVLQAAVAAQTYTLGLFGSNDSAKLLPVSDRILGIKSPTGKLADIAPSTILERVWQS
jgi:ADP-heptose:LPS heptosyltransferase